MEWKKKKGQLWKWLDQLSPTGCCCCLQHSRPSFLVDAFPKSHVSLSSFCFFFITSWMKMIWNLWVGKKTKKKTFSFYDGWNPSRKKEKYSFGKKKSGLFFERHLKSLSPFWWRMGKCFFGKRQPYRRTPSDAFQKINRPRNNTKGERKNFLFSFPLKKLIFWPDSWLDYVIQKNTSK
jgi:hypothetical protein